MTRLALASVLVCASVAASSAGQQSTISGGVTPMFVCGADQTLPAPLPATWAHVALAADSRLFTPCPDNPAGRHPENHREVREWALLVEALGAAAPPEVRRAAARARGRLGRPDGNLADPDPAVRREVANAFAEPLSTEAGPGESNLRASLVGRLEARLETESDESVVAVILESLGRFRYADDAARDRAEAILVAASTKSAASARVLGAAKGLEALIRLSPKRAIGQGARQRLRELAVVGVPFTAVPTLAGPGSADAPGDADNYARTRRLALMALNAVRDDDLTTLNRAARDADWQVRRLVAQRVNYQIPELADIGTALQKDAVFQVRFDMLMPLSRQAALTKSCAALATFFDDAETTVVLRAIDLLPASCSDRDEIAKRLVTLAATLKERSSTWHRGAHALVALARLAPDSARPLIGDAVAHPVWQVRAMAATAAGTLKDTDTVIALAADDNSNVRNAALETLSRLGSPAVTTAATAALALGWDVQLVRTAARVLAKTPADQRDAVNAALLEALRVLTKKASDTSRDTRVAIVERLAELLPAERASELIAFGDDFDPVVRAAIGKAYSALAKTDLPPANPRRRYPLQPTAEFLVVLPSRASITMAGGGTIVLELFVEQAPVTVARFVQLASAGHYNRLTFHRVEPNFVIQGGSFFANEYVGVDWYMRDEVGLVPHVRGAVGISTRGPDTGDGQIFIDLVDLPRLDHAYTVFARVLTGLDVVDRVLAGAVIQSISVK